MENLKTTPRELFLPSTNPRTNPISQGTRWKALWMACPLACAAFLILWTCVSPNLLHGQTAVAPKTAHKEKPAAHAATVHAATAQAATTRTGTTHRTVHRRATARRAALHPAKAAAATPAAPPRPAWPAEQPANPAKVTWDSHGLAIEASNSSLDQILHDVAAETGVKLQGLDQDERIFGNYGPGPAREVLSRLLDGSGYDLLMIGGQGDEPPQQLILSKSAGPQPANNVQTGNRNQENDADEPPLQPGDTPMPVRDQFGGAGPPNRTAQEIQQEMLLREQQNEQPREPEQQNNPQF